MNVLFLIQSFIPSEKETEYLSILRQTITSIKGQISAADLGIRIILSDDGSDYLAQVAGPTIESVPNETVTWVRVTFDLEIDEIVLISASSTFNKAKLWDFALTRFGHDSDVVIFLDDDQAFVRDDSLDRIVKHVAAGYNFVVGRLYHPLKGFRSYYDKKVQGTTYALTLDALREVRFFGENVERWGTGDDPEMFWKLYLAYQSGYIRGIYDGNIITIDQISGRWQYCLEKAGGGTNFAADFQLIYQVNPFDNPSRNKVEWLAGAQDTRGINERDFPYIKINEYLASFERRMIYKLVWRRRRLTWNSRNLRNLRTLLGSLWHMELKGES